MPRVLLIGKSGKIMYKGNPSEIKSLESTLDKLINGEEGDVETENDFKTA